jgi:hypothetical protein
MIKHFLKCLELVALLNYNNEGTTYGFLDKVLNKFDNITKIFTNQGTKFHGEFEELCEKTLIDHHTTSQDCPKVDGLTK